MKTALMLFVLFASPVLAAPEQYEDCTFVLSWARQAAYIATKIELPEDRWRITEEGFEPEEYEMIRRIKHEAYHDIPALTKRVALACGQKEAV